jgi:two-component system cell cycle response regulator
MSAPTQKTTPAKADARDRGRVLLITEEPADLLSRTLETTGLEIVGVSRGSAALISLQRSRPHLVVASTTVKGISPVELARTLSQTQDGVPLILVGRETATIERRIEALSAGAFDYLELPAEVALLSLRVQQLVIMKQVTDRLRADADLDYLTGLANRRRFRRALAREVERWRRYGVPCALLLLDIDHMKAINDQHGHTAGDSVIRHIADTLLTVSRDNDTAARVGGEEFALLLAGTAGEKAQHAADRLRTILSQKMVEGVGRVTVSIGVATCPEHANSERTLYSVSDQALYVAKNTGRDRVSVAPLLQEKLPGI